MIDRGQAALAVLLAVVMATSMVAMSATAIGTAGPQEAAGIDAGETTLEGMGDAAVAGLASGSPHAVDDGDDGDDDEGENDTIERDGVADRGGERDPVSSELRSKLSADERGPATLDAEDRIDVVVVAEPGEAAAVEAAVRAEDGDVDVAYEGHVAAEIPARAVDALAERDVVRHVREPAAAVPAGIDSDDISEGVETMRADRLHEAGVTGENATIAVIDDEFNPDNEKIADQVVETENFGGAGFNDEAGHHGTASAEVVADVAPDADLVLVSIGDDMDFINATDWIENETDADAVTMSLGWYPNIGSLDGTDHISQRIAESRDEGLVWTVAAGNSGEYRLSDDVYAGQHWDGAYEEYEEGESSIDGVPGEFMEFDIVDDYPTILPIRDLGGGAVIVSWDADWDADDQEYVVHVWGHDGDDLQYVEERSTTNPYEAYISQGQWEWIYLEIENVDADGDQHFDVFTRSYAGQEDLWFLDEDEYTVHRSLLIPATSPDAITVGGVHHGTDELVRYSSRGPTTDERQGVDVVAPTHVSQLERSTYTGTSAATPHVGGVAGLLAGLGEGTLTDEEIEDAIGASGRNISGDQTNLLQDLSAESIGSGHVDASDAYNESVVLAGMGSIEVTVTDSVTDESVADATVTVTDDDESVGNATTDDEGAASIEVEPGSYDVEVEHPDYHGNETGVEVDFAETVELAVELEPENATIEGQVTDALEQASIENATVALEDAEGELQSVSTDAEGEYEIEDVPVIVESYTLTADHDEYLANETEVTVGANETTAVDFELYPEPTAFEISYAVDRTSVNVSENVTVTATVNNTDETEETAMVLFYSDGEEFASEEVTLSGGNSTTVQATTSFDEAGEYDVWVNELDPTTITVEQAEPSLSDYATEDGIVRPAGILRAIDDWRAGIVAPPFILELIDYWRSGEPVP